MPIRQCYIHMKTKHVHNGSLLFSWPQPKLSLSLLVPVSKWPSPSPQLHKQKLESSLMISFLTPPSNLPWSFVYYISKYREHAECWFCSFPTHIFLVHITIFSILTGPPASFLGTRVNQTLPDLVSLLLKTLQGSPSPLGWCNLQAPSWFVPCLPLLTLLPPEVFG